MPLNTEAPILIDLRTALTDEVIAEALPNLGKCMYAAPCVIGAMLPADRRSDFDAGFFGTSIKAYLDQGSIRFADEVQAKLAVILQTAFDGGSTVEFNDALTHVRAHLAEQVA